MVYIITEKRLKYWESLKGKPVSPKMVNTGRTRFKKGIHSSSKTEFKKGEHYSPATEFKKGIHPQTEWKEKNKNPFWKDENAKYNSKHAWITFNYGSPPYCEDCGKKGEYTIFLRIGNLSKRWNIDWSNKDHNYRRIKEDYNGRCQRCHWKYDKSSGLR